MKLLFIDHFGDEDDGGGDVLPNYDQEQKCAVKFNVDPLHSRPLRVMTMINSVILNVSNESNYDDYSGKDNDDEDYGDEVVDENDDDDVDDDDDECSLMLTHCSGAGAGLQRAKVQL